MAKVIGNLPEDIIYICRGKTEAINRFDDIDEDIEKIIVTPAYVSDANNETTIESGRSWASYFNWSYIESEVTEEEADKVRNSQSTRQHIYKRWSHDEQRYKLYKSVYHENKSVEIKEDRMKNEPIKNTNGYKFN